MDFPLISELAVSSHLSEVGSDLIAAGLSIIIASHILWINLAVAVTVVIRIAF